MARIATPSRLNENSQKRGNTTYYDLSSAGTFTVAAGQATSATSPTITQTSAGIRMQWTAANNGQQVGIRLTPPSTLNFSNVNQFGFEFSFGSDATAATYGGLRILMKSNAAGSYANYYNQLQYTGNNKFGRRVLQMPKTGFTVGAGSPAWNNIQSIELVWQRSTVSGTATPLDITVHGMYAEYKTQTPTLVFTFDDNDLTQYTEAYLGTTYAGTGMKDYGWTGTLFMNSGSFNVAGSQPTKMTVANAQTMYAAGWDVFNHTDSHIANCWQYTGAITGTGPYTLTLTGSINHRKNNGDTVTVFGIDPPECNGSFTSTIADSTHMAMTIPTPSFTTNVGGYNVIEDLPMATLSADIDTCTAFLTANGFTKCTDHYAYPYGYHSPQVINLLQQKGFKSARIIGSMTGSVESNAGYWWNTVAQNPKSLDWYRVPCRSLSSSDTTLAAIQADIDKAIKYGSNIVLCTHNLISVPAVSRDADLEVWVSLLALIKRYEMEGKLQVKKYSDFYNSVIQV